MMSPYITVEQAIADYKQGKMLILVDDESRENEGDLIIAADSITPEAINFMATHGRGLICLAMAEELIDKLQLPMMVNNNLSPYETAFTVSIEAAKGVTTGISAKDRAHTIKLAVSSEVTPGDIVSPGHVFPLKAKNKGVLERQGQTEGSVDMARLAQMTPASVICEIINDDGTMARSGDLKSFAQKHDIGILTIESLIKHRIAHESLINEEARSRLPMNNYGEFELAVFSNQLDDMEHFVLIKPPVKANEIPLVRLHSECITGDIFGSAKCDCGQQLHDSLKQISEHGGILIYLRQEGRGIGLSNKIKAYALQEQGYDTVDANLILGLPIDKRDYSIAYQILKYLGLTHIRLITNNPDKISLLEEYGIHVCERVALGSKSTVDNQHYLETKKNKLGHFLTLN
jgi:3,4-dihydroxy 2-butanone 4-phosphate synthase/GTP cyclohydrolase II